MLVGFRKTRMDTFYTQHLYDRTLYSRASHQIDYPAVTMAETPVFFSHSASRRK